MNRHTDNASNPANAGGPNPAAMRLAIGASALLALAAAGAFYFASEKERTSSGAGDEVAVTIHSHGCEPASLSVPAGKASFRILNKSDRAVEWEILDGVMVLAERENIAPGLSQTIRTSLEPGDYTVTCGLLSNPRGSLHVTPTAASLAAAHAAPPMSAFIGALSEYRFYLNRQSGQLLDQVKLLQTTLGDGDLAAARSAYLDARASYQRIAATAGRYGVLDNRIDARSDYFAKREQDPAFGGFHRIEYGLFAQNSTDGLAPVATQLETDVTALRDALLARTPAPEHLAGDAARLMQGLADGRATEGVEYYSHTDLEAFAASLDGVRKVVSLLDPLLKKPAPAEQQRLNQAVTAFAKALDDCRRDGAYLSYDQVDATRRKQIAQAAAALASALDAANPALGLNNG